MFFKLADLGGLGKFYSGYKQVGGNPKNDRANRQLTTNKNARKRTKNIKGKRPTYK